MEIIKSPMLEKEMESSQESKFTTFLASSNQTHVTKVHNQFLYKQQAYGTYLPLPTKGLHFNVTIFFTITIYRNTNPNSLALSWEQELSRVERAVDKALLFHQDIIYRLFISW